MTEQDKRTPSPSPSAGDLARASLAELLQCFQKKGDGYATQTVSPAVIERARYALHPTMPLREWMQRPRNGGENRLTRIAYQELVVEDIRWLDRQQPSLSRDHIRVIVLASVDGLYPPEPRMGQAKDVCQRCVGWEQSHAVRAAVLAERERCSAIADQYTDPDDLGDSAAFIGRAIRDESRTANAKYEECHGWELKRGQDVVLCPGCGFGMHADHSTPVGPGAGPPDYYSCPNCHHGEREPLADALPTDPHPWGAFLHARARCLRWLRDVRGSTPNDTCRTMSMDPVQVRMILDHVDSSPGEYPPEPRTPHATAQDGGTDK